jgi:hypothetical protein
MEGRPAKRLKGEEDVGIVVTVSPAPAPPRPPAVPPPPTKAELRCPPMTPLCGVRVDQLFMGKGGSAADFVIDVWPDVVRVQNNGGRRRWVFTFGNQRIPYTMGKLIGKSRWGKVWEFRPVASCSGCGWPSYVLKTYRWVKNKKGERDRSEERKEVLLVNEYNEQLRVMMVPSMVIYTRPGTDDRGILMQRGIPLNNEDALEMAINPNRDVAKRIEYLKNIMKAAETCLEQAIKSGFAYFDVKTDNMLLIPCESGTRLCFADWGGVGKWFREESDPLALHKQTATTYPLPENKYGPFYAQYGKSWHEIRLAMRYLLAVAAGTMVFPKELATKMRFAQYVKLHTNMKVVPQPADSQMELRNYPDGSTDYVCLKESNGLEIGVPAKKPTEIYFEGTKKMGDFFIDPIGHQSLSDSMAGFGQHFGYWLASIPEERLKRDS